MRVSHVLKRLPGITKRDLEYWESAGYIKPTRLPKARISRRDYGPVFRKVELMWQLYSAGSRPAEAHKRAEEILSQQKAGPSGDVRSAQLFLGDEELAQLLQDRQHESGSARALLFAPRTDDGIAAQVRSGSLELRLTGRQSRAFGAALHDSAKRHEAEVLLAMSPACAVVVGAALGLWPEGQDCPSPGHAIGRTSAEASALGGAGGRRSLVVMEVALDAAGVLQTADDLRRAGWDIVCLVALTELLTEEDVTALDAQDLPIEVLMSGDDVLGAR